MSGRASHCFFLNNKTLYSKMSYLVSQPMLKTNSNSLFIHFNFYLKIDISLNIEGTNLNTFISISHIQFREDTVSDLLIRYNIRFYIFENMI